MLFVLRRERLIVVAILACSNFLVLCSCVCTDKNGRETDLTVTSERSIYDEDEPIEQAYDDQRRDAAKIDAFNYDICGKSRQRDWQSREKAWNCGYHRSTGRQRWSARSLSKQRISDGEFALDGEFPSFVNLLLSDPYDSDRCGGTLIHSNLVITAAHCIEHMINVTAVLDSNRVDGSGGYKVEADRWCHTRRTSLYVDLGMVRLSRKVEYVANKVWPACLLLDNRHKNNTACAVVGMGNVRDKEHAERLKTLPIRRTCTKGEHYPYVSCYQADSIGGTCVGDSGSGVYCYDNCYADDQRAFVVAAVSGGSGSTCKLGQRPTQFFTDFNWMADSVKALISKLVSDDSDNNVTCYNRK